MSRVLKNLVNGKWLGVNNYRNIYNVFNGKLEYKVPDTQINELTPFINSMRRVPKSGLHNPFKSPERYLMLGDICFKTAHSLHISENEERIVNEIISVTGKTEDQAYGELRVTRKFLENFSGDQVRFLAKGFNTPGDHFGQLSNGFRFPYGAVSVISPFNFPLEIPLLQLMGALFMGNKPVLKVDSRVSLVMDSMLKIMHENGLSRWDVDFIHCEGNVMEELLKRGNVRMTQFTGSSRIVERLSRELNGKVKIEGGGFDWKIIGKREGLNENLIYDISTKDAYSFSGQKCSAQSLLFIDESWDLNKFKDNLRSRAYEETIGPVITLSSKEMIDHVNKLLEIEGFRD
jgi:1-pyrroline-5-carboxylate dehydrogenase